MYQIAGSSDYVRDMRIHEKLSSLLICLMEDAWSGEKASNNTPSAVDIQQVKEYLDLNYTRTITLDDLAARFFINKYYLLKLFKERYGVTIKAYLNQVRVTYVKQLRFTDKTVECLAVELGMEPNYLSRLFKKDRRSKPERVSESAERKIRAELFWIVKALLIFRVFTISENIGKLHNIYFLSTCVIFPCRVRIYYRIHEEKSL